MTFSLDRIEGDVAVLIDDNDKTVNVPLSDLPSTAQCGDVLSIVDGAYCVDIEKTEKRRSYVLSLQEKLRRRK